MGAKWNENKPRDCLIKKSWGAKWNKKKPRDCLIETALAEETRLEAKLLNDTEIELYKVGALLHYLQVE